MGGDGLPTPSADRLDFYQQVCKFALSSIKGNPSSLEPEWSNPSNHSFLDGIHHSGSKPFNSFISLHSSSGRSNDAV